MENGERASERVRARNNHVRFWIVKLLFVEGWIRQTHCMTAGWSRSCCCQSHETLGYSFRLLIASHQCHVAARKKGKWWEIKSSHKYGNFQEEMRCYCNALRRCSAVLFVWGRQIDGTQRIRSAKTPSSVRPEASQFLFLLSPIDGCRQTDGSSAFLLKWVIEMMLENDLTEINTLQHSVCNTSSYLRSFGGSSAMHTHKHIHFDCHLSPSWTNHVQWRWLDATVCSIRPST